MIAGGQDLKSADAEGSLLHAAAAGGSAEIVGVLLDKGSETSRADRFGWTPLHYAAWNGRADAAGLLVGRGAPIDARTLMGQTAYNVARERAMEPVAALLAAKGADTSAIRFPALRGDYLGQKPPAAGAALFAPGIVSSIWGLHSTAVFSPDGNEVYWAPMMSFPGEIYSRGGLLMMKRVDGRWTPPAWAPFSGPDVDDDVPFFSPDGRRIYFISTAASSRRIGDRSRTDLVRRQNGRRMVRADAARRRRQRARHALGVLPGPPGEPLFRRASPRQPRHRATSISRSARGEKYEKPVNLGAPINSAEGETTPFIAPDGSYLLFSRQYDLWVSFRGRDGAWSEPVKLGPEFNSPSIELCPIVTADGKYLFFLSQRDGESHAYWAPAAAIFKLRPTPRMTRRNGVRSTCYSLFE